MKVNQDIMNQIGASFASLNTELATHVQIATRTTDGLMNGALIFGIL